MWHADDGDLHAYLDGALDFYPAGDAQRIREHLESCSECRQRLEQERALAGRAREVLAGSGPAQPMAPPFEEIRRRAEGGAAAGIARPRRFHPQRWAWAATVILALGIGWRIGVGPGSVGAPVEERDAAPAEAPVVGVPEVESFRDLTAGAGAAAQSAAPPETQAAAESAEREQREVAQPEAARIDLSTSPLTEEMARAASNAAAGAAPSAPPPSSSFSFRATDLTGVGVRGGVAAGRAAAAADSSMFPGSPTTASPFAGRGLGGLAGGRITGLTVAAGTQAPVSEAQVSLVGQNVGTLTRQNGQFVLDNVPPGTYELRVERIGMTTQTRQVTVAAGQNLEANFDLVEQALGLDEVVVTGAAGAARRREVGNAVTVVPPAAPLSLPGIPIRSVDWVEVATGVQGIRVTQGVDLVPVELYFVGVQLEAPTLADATAAPRVGGAGGVSPVPSPAPPPPPPAAAPPPPRPAAPSEPAAGAGRSAVVGGRAAPPAAPAQRAAAVEPPPSLITVPLPTGWRQLAQPFRGGWVIIRAPLPDDRLRELLERAGAGAPSH